MATPHVPTTYTILILPTANRQLRKLQKTRNPRASEILKAIGSLSTNPRRLGSRKLVNRAEWRIRIGDYRVLFLIDDLRRTVTISFIAHRRDVYR